MLIKMTYGILIGGGGGGGAVIGGAGGLGGSGAFLFFLLSQASSTNLLTLGSLRSFLPCANCQRSNQEIPALPEKFSGV